MKGMQTGAFGASAELRFDEKAPAMSATAGRVSPRRASAGRAGTVAAMIGGLATMAVAGVLAVTAFTGPSEGVPAPGPVPEPSPARSDVSLTDLTYAPGHSSGWHTHPGLHSVVVLGGTLTIYDEHCGRQEYGPGSAYLGGDRPHLARNEGAGDLSIVVTSIYDRGPSEQHGSSVAAPPGCDGR